MNCRLWGRIRGPDESKSARLNQILSPFTVEMAHTQLPKTILHVDDHYTQRQREEEKGEDRGGHSGVGCGGPMDL